MYVKWSKLVETLAIVPDLAKKSVKFKLCTNGHLKIGFQNYRRLPKVYNRLINIINSVSLSIGIILFTFDVFDRKFLISSI